ncbi:MAG: hypothetical protein COA84_12205 [Robiginitomaculum sp.]|nr:MAG: hypothetical protein COA84_12205 [Robiginitomaculum sp.]
MLDAVLIALIFFAAGIVRGFTGFGFALAAVPLLVFIFPPALIVPVVLLLDMAAGGMASVQARRMANMRMVMLLSVPSLALVPLGAMVLGNLSEETARLSIGLIVILAVPGLLYPLRLNTKTKLSQLIAMGTGGVSGLMNGAFGLGGPPIGLFMASSTMVVESIRATTIVYFLVADTGAVLSNAIVGNVGMNTLKISAFSLIFVLMGNQLGTVLFKKFGSKIYRQSIGVLLLLNGLVLVATILI